MELQGDITINAPRAQVWAALNDAATLQACIPGCESVVDESPDVRLVKLMVKMGPVRARFAGRVTVSEVRVAEGCVMAFEGSGGAAGMASGRSQVALHDAGEGTRLTYTVKASVGGKLGQIGGRMMDASAKQLADQFFGALQAKLAPAVEPFAPESIATNRHSTLAPPVKSIETPLSGLSQAPQQPHPEVQRLLWFAMGVAATGFGVWLGAKLFA